MHADDDGQKLLYHRHDREGHERDREKKKMMMMKKKKKKKKTKKKMEKKKACQNGNGPVRSVIL